MENLTAVDGGAALIILVSSILAFSRGLVRELMAILGWIGAAIALTRAPRLASASTAPVAAAAPAMSCFIRHMFSEGLIEMPPVSKVTPFPTKATGASSPAPR